MLTVTPVKRENSIGKSIVKKAFPEVSINKEVVLPVNQIPVLKRKSSIGIKPIPLDDSYLAVNVVWVLFFN